MRTTLLWTIAITTLLAGCTTTYVASPTNDPPLAERLHNPLYAEYYFDDLTEQMLTLALREDPSLQDATIRNMVDRTRTESLERAAAAVKAQKEGRIGPFLSDRELVFGEALLLDHVLYFGPTFDSAPGPSLHTYLTTVVDPREDVFPDPTAIALGPLKDQYGAQSFAVPPDAESGSTIPLRTVVLWDNELEILYGFAQLATTN